jgi:asparagine synthase (glutamine-hydrolysing)
MVLGLSELISRAVEQSLEDRAAVSFSGGLDSTVIAAVAKKHAEIELFSCGCTGSPDMVAAKKAAEELGLALNTIPLDEKAMLDAYGKVHSILQLDFLKLEILVPVHCVAEAAAKSGHKVLLFGTAAEELFVGYERYYTYKEEGKDLDSILREEFKTLPQRDMGRIKKVCRKFGIEARFPFYDKKIAEAVFCLLHPP